jgi:hypothetical protein
MTEVAGSVKQVGQGLTQKTFKYDALGSLVDIITNSAGKEYRSINLRHNTDNLYRSGRPGCGTKGNRRWWKRRRRRRKQLCTAVSDTIAGTSYSAE